MEGDGNLLLVGLGLSNTVNVDDKLLAVHLSDTSLSLGVLSTDNSDLVILADGHGADAVLLAVLLGKSSGHHLVADHRGGSEVSLTVLAAGAGDGCGRANIVLEIHGGSGQGREAKNRDIVVCELKTEIMNRGLYRLAGMQTTPWRSGTGISKKRLMSEGGGGSRLRGVENRCDSNEVVSRGYDSMQHSRLASSILSPQGSYSSSFPIHPLVPGPRIGRLSR